MSESPAGREPAARAWGAFAICSLVWGSTFLAIRLGDAALAPVWAAALRLVLASVLLALLALVTRQRWPRGAALRAAVLFGVVDFGISLPLLYWGEQEVPSAVAAIVYALIPLLTSAFARVAGLERTSPLKLLAAGVGLAGVVVLVSAQVRGHVGALPLVAVFLGAATAALAGVVLKAGPRSSPIALNAIAHAAGAPFCIVASFALHERHALPATSAGWLPVVYLTIVGSVIAFVTFTWLVQRWSVVRTSFIAVITPAIATALGALVAHERLEPSAGVGAAIVLAGVALAIASDARNHAR